MPGCRAEVAGTLRIPLLPYVLADNKLAETAGWDKELLAIELQGLIELDVDIEVTSAHNVLTFRVGGRQFATVNMPDDGCPYRSRRTPATAYPSQSDCCGGRPIRERTSS
jgi:hypothetical protein